MLITRLRLTGFKSFVDPTELVIEPGLTGVVGPNGCGKSNLLEALRWVMGETSYKSMRGSAMEDVIFSGTAGRPARNTADVTLVLDNRRRTAPAEFNDVDELEVTRRIERDAGSTYKVNGREVRARDVRVLFEDAATGARSPALVRQGQIGDIVNARPDQRRRILEDAAGIAGLHSRRHDAELRLKASETNLLRVSDVLGQMKSQIDGLKRQARQAQRYANLSEQIRAAEALTLYLKWGEAQRDVATEEAALREVQSVVSSKISLEAGLITRSAEFAAELERLRKTEAERAAALTRLTIARENLDNEIAGAEARLEELSHEIERVSGDRARETAQLQEAQQRVAELESELRSIADLPGHEVEQVERLQSLIAELRLEVARREEHHHSLSVQAMQQASALRLAETRLADKRAEAARAADRLDQLRIEAATAEKSAPSSDDLEDLENACRETEAAYQRISSALDEARDTAARLAVMAREKRDLEAAARLEAKGIDTEHATLSRLIGVVSDDGWSPVLDAMTVEHGFEAAVGAALGDTLDAPADSAAAAYWVALPAGEGDPRLPPGVQPLSEVVQVPRELERVIAQIGIVDSAESGRALQPRLAAGQVLVTQAGDVWRWDGFVATASAPGGAAKRLAERNRLIEVEARASEAARLVGRASAVREEAEREQQAAASRSAELETELRKAEADVRISRDALMRHTQQLEAHAARSAATSDALRRAEHDYGILLESITQFEMELRNTPAPDLSSDISAAADARDEARTALADAEQQLAVCQREFQLRRQSIEALEKEIVRWRSRISNSEAHAAALADRAVRIEQLQSRLRPVPNSAREKREALAEEIAAAETARTKSADAIAAAENGAREVASQLRSINSEMAAARERKARVETHLESARMRRTQIAQSIQAEFGVRPEGCVRLTGLEHHSKLPTLAKAEDRLAKLRLERERLGGVNLEATGELDRISTEFEKLSRDRSDIEDAVSKLRAGISRLNREARQRLVASFETVNRHFASLFETLFGGGEAQLEFIEHEDPLQGGLDIIARPPGKKPVTLSLLSGGEQTLTALSLIFAVFLTNPSPICVLDEVDAPLDDSNVDRFCTLMERMAGETDTRFLVITHHPLTMSRMNRLFGVTMAERGISQLVSVDLETAERFREAG